MSDDRANAGEGADPSKDIDQQNPGETTTHDLTDDEDTSDTKTQDLAKARRTDFDPNAGQE